MSDTDMEVAPSSREKIPLYLREWGETNSYTSISIKGREEPSTPGELTEGLSPSHARQNQ